MIVIGNNLLQINFVHSLLVRDLLVRFNWTNKYNSIIYGFRPERSSDPGRFLNTRTKIRTELKMVEKSLVALNLSLSIFVVFGHFSVNVSNVTLRSWPISYGLTKPLSATFWECHGASFVDKKYTVTFLVLMTSYIDKNFLLYVNLKPLE